MFAARKINCVAALLVFSLCACQKNEPVTSAAIVQVAKPAPAFVVEEASVAQLQDAMSKGKTSALEITQAYLKRIAEIDKTGAAINAIIELNPDAETIAASLDEERKAGKLRGPLHGIPVLLKDNIDTGDKMHTTAGSLALANNIAKQDSGVAEKLRAAGMIILGKTNLSEWANFRGARSTSGWSAVGGLTKNPYVLDRNVCGSSSGTGAAIAASLAAVGIGTETNGSIVCPSSLTGLVGIKPTLGLVSRAGIIPIAHSQDTAGPMARTVADAVALFSVMQGADSRDAITNEVPADVNRDYMAALKTDGLKGKRIGVVRELLGFHFKVDALMEASIAKMKAAGAEIIDPVDLPDRPSYGDASGVVLSYEFKADLAAYLATTNPEQVPHRSLADIIAFNAANAEKEMQWFAQERMIEAEASGELTDKKYLDALAQAKKATQEGIDKAMDEHKLDALVAATAGPAWVTDLVNGGGSSGGSSSHAAVAGYPNITVSAGLVDELPVGISFFGRAFSEATLIEIAYGFEQVNQGRQPPNMLKTYP